ncbi:hypothetical protein PHMEG_0009838 [Phytophthora megakarya]|uniref:Uncharacterized protein n=1 Tax=Phytophthora megakarya TaxID=4795 RepID=A0A225WF80_9STRA|nr:hypothetical protein PHMEG_0009838 [Phytophthora megakarya]
MCNYRALVSTTHVVLWLATHEAFSDQHIVLQVDGARDADFPVRVDTGELLPGDMIIRRITDCDGSISETKWRELRTFHLVQGTFTPSRASELADVLETAFAGHMRPHCDMREGNPSMELQSEEETIHPEDESYADVEQSSIRTTASDTAAVEDIVRTLLKEDHASEGTEQTSPTDEESPVELAASARTDSEVFNAEEYLRSIPNRHARAKILTRKAGSWRLICEPLKKAA